MKKKITLTIIAISISSLAICQQLDTNSVAVFNVPNLLLKQPKTKQIGTNNTNKTINEKEGYLKFYINNPKADTYKSNDVIKFLSVYGTKIVTKASYLEDIKKGMDEIATMDRAKKPFGYSTVIKEIKDFSVLTMSTERDDYIKFSIFCVDDKHTSVLNAMMIIMKKDSVNAEKALEGFLKGIKFK